MTDAMRSLCRIVVFVLMWNGVDHFTPAFPWWARGCLYLGAAAALQFGWLGAAWLSE